MRSIKLIVQYIGTQYCGWQVQPNGPTVQGVLQAVLFEILQEEVSVIGSGRTDSGVHALAQVAHFRTESNLGCEVLQKALNAKLPPDIAIRSVEEINSDFHAGRHSTAKTYSYFLLHSARKVPFLSPYAWRLWGKLDLDPMHQCLERLVGKQDFAAFKAADSEAKTSVRELYSVAIQPLKIKDLIRSLSTLTGLEGILAAGSKGDRLEFSYEKIEIIGIHFRGKGFLKHMVRNIVGTIVEVGQGKRTVKEFGEIFASKDRTQAGVTAPARGLFLIKVEY